jgi:hypothetical protein
MLIDFLRSDGVDKLLKQLPENDIAEADELMVLSMRRDTDLSYI